MNIDEARKLLREHGQSQLLNYYDLLDETQRRHLLGQIEALDWRLLESLKAPATNAAQTQFEPLQAMRAAQIAAKEGEYRELGLAAIRSGKVGAVLLAGGQGTRLGFDKPKGMLNVGLTRFLSLFEILVGNLRRVTGAAGCYIPFYIMTSEKNHRETVSFFEEQQYFGYPKSFIRFFQQQTAPCVDFDGKILLEGPDRIALSPNGNGGWFESLCQAGYLAEIHEQGLEWLNVFSVDNVLQSIADPIMLGAVLDSGAQSGAKVVRKASPDERVGVLCLKNGRPAVVEYYEMTEEMRYSRLTDGELAYNWGVTLNYLFRVDCLEKILHAPLPVHYAEKKIPYLDAEGRLIRPEQPNGYKFETLILDMVHLMNSCLGVEVLRSREFAPIKNKTGADSLETARALLLENHINL